MATGRSSTPDLGGHARNRVGARHMLCRCNDRDFQIRLHRPDRLFEPDLTLFDGGSVAFSEASLTLTHRVGFGHGRSRTWTGAATGGFCGPWARVLGENAIVAEDQGRQGLRAIRKVSPILVQELYVPLEEGRDQLPDRSSNAVWVSVRICRRSARNPVAPHPRIVRFSVKPLEPRYVHKRNDIARGWNLHWGRGCEAANPCAMRPLGRRRRRASPARRRPRPRRAGPRPSPRPG